MRHFPNKFSKRELFVLKSKCRNVVVHHEVVRIVWVVEIPEYVSKAVNLCPTRYRRMVL